MAEVEITGARLDVGGFVVVTEGSVESIVGVTDYLDGETRHADIGVRLDGPIDSFTRLVATARLDVDGDHSFDQAIDRPYPVGNPVNDSAIVEPAVTPTPTDTPPPPPLGDGGDVFLALAGGSLGPLTPHATARVAGRIRHRSAAETIRPSHRRSTSRINHGRAFQCCSMEGSRSIPTRTIR